MHRKVVAALAVWLLMMPLGGKAGQHTSQPKTVSAITAAEAIMTLADVKPGQIGKIRTVFKGTEVEEFQCEVLGILKNSIGPGKDMIMIKLRGDKPEFTGVVAGMSGSPVYIDGKLVGALAYRWGIFTKEPIAGVTPIEDMLEVGNYGTDSKPRRASVERFNPSSTEVTDDLLYSRLWQETQESEAATQASAASPSMMAPISTPLVFSGFDRRLFDRFAGFFRKNNFVPTMGGGTSGDVKQDTPFEPGAAVSCVLMSGDMSIAGTGTLTYRAGDRVLGFGHPMFQSGEADIPMAKAKIVLTLSSSYASFKLAEPTEIVGSIKQDRLTAIMGKVGSMARMIPVSVEVNPARGKKKTFNFQMFEEPFFTPLLLNIATVNTLLGGMDYESSQTITLNGQIEIDGHPSVNVNDAMASEDTDAVFPLAFRASSYLTRLFSGLYTNPLERPVVKRITLRVDQSAERKGTAIEEVRADREEVKPGDEIVLAVLMRPYRGERTTKIVKFRLPETAERGQELRVMVSDARSFEAAEGVPGRSFVGGTGSLDELIAQLNRSRPSNAIYIRASQNTRGASINQQVLPSLPLSVLSVIGSSQTAANTTTAADSPLLTATEPVDYVISGRKYIRLIVK